MKELWEFFLLNWNSGIEIALIAVALYYTYIYLERTHAARILVGLCIIVLTLIVISQLLNLAVIGWMLRSISVFMALVLVVLFQKELRTALMELGSKPWFSSAFHRRESIDLLIDASFDLSRKGFGGLIAIEKQIDLSHTAENGTELDAILSSELIQTIFHPKTSLHDGGIIVKADRIVAAACIFPVSQREDLERTLGTRHRAGVGITENSDAICIVVSEETGQVSICTDGKIIRPPNVEQFRRTLNAHILIEKYENLDSSPLERKADQPNSRSSSLVHDPGECSP